MNEAYSVYVKITALDDGISNVLRRTSSQFTSLQHKADKLHGTFEKMNKLMKAAALTGAGTIGFFGFEKILKPANDYAHQLALMNAQGMTHLQILKSIQAVHKSAFTVPTSSYAEGLSTIREARMVFTGKDQTAEAIQFMPLLEKINYVLNSFTGGRAGDQSYDLAKALEIRGATRSTAMFQDQADLMAKAIIASGGKIGAADFQSTFKYGKTAATQWSDAFTYTILPTFIQEMKGRSGASGGGAGNPLMSFYQAIVGGTMSNKGAEEFLKLGLINKNDVIFTKTGSVKGLRPGAVKGQAEFQQNPYQWTQDFLVPALINAGYDTPAKMAAEIPHLVTNRNAQLAAIQFATQQYKYIKDMQLIAKTPGIASYNQLLKSDPIAADMALQKQWNNILAELGFSIMPTLLKGMEKLIHWFTELSNWMDAHQNATSALMYSLATVTGGAGLLGFVSTLKLVKMGVVSVIGEEALGGLAATLSGLAAPALALASALFVLNRAFDTFKDPVGVAKADAQGTSFLSKVIKPFQNFIPGANAFFNTDPNNLASKAGSSMNSTINQSHVPLHATIMVGGKTVTKVITKAQAKAANAPNTSTTTFNPSHTLSYPSHVLNGNS
jgi:hypothetical protein